MSTALNQLYKFLGKRKKVFIENTSKYWPLKEFEEYADTLNKPSSVLSCAFAWGRTEQGNKYWSDIHCKICLKEDYP